MSAAHRRQLQLAAHAHCMREAPSEPERLLWQALRCSQLGVWFFGGRPCSFGCYGGCERVLTIAKAAIQTKTSVSPRTAHTRQGAAPTVSCGATSA
jgi:hypothetical protein